MPEIVDVQFSWVLPCESQDLQLPYYATTGAAGMDVAAAITEDVVMQPGQIVLIPTGFAVAIPAGYELQVRPRSGLAIKHGITIINAPGTIDSDYRGEVKIGLVNLGSDPFTIHRGDRIAQLVLARVARCVMRPVAVLDDTERSTGGFGHSGV